MNTQLAYDRLIDRQPAKDGHAILGKVLSRNVTRPVQVGVQLKAALSTVEPSAGAAIVTGDVPAAATSLRGMPGINPGHRTAPLFSFVLDKGLQLSKRPRVQSAALSAVALLSSATDIGQVLQDKRSAFGDASGNFLGEDVVAVATEASLSPSESAQVTIGGLSTLLLEAAPELKQARLNASPAVLSQELIVGGDGGLRQSQVNAYHIASGINIWFGKIHYNMQPEIIATSHQVSGSERKALVPSGVAWQREGNSHAPLDSGEPDRVRSPLQLEGVNIEARSAGTRTGTGNLPPLPLESQGALDRLGSLDAGLDMQVRDKTRILCFERVIGSMVELDAVLLTMLPSVGSDGVKGRGEQAHGLRERHCLLCGGLELSPHRPIHSTNIPYIKRICKKEGDDSSAN